MDRSRARCRARRCRTAAAYAAIGRLNRTGAIAAAAIAAAFAIGAVAARIALAHAPAFTRAALAQPMPVADTWGAFGGLCFAVLAVTVAVAGGALCILVASAPRDGVRHGGAIVIVVATIALAGAACWPFAFSSDPYAYAAYGEMAARGLDPYALVPPSAHGVSIDAARFQWHGAYPVCVYGPAFVAVARAAWTLAGEGRSAAAPVALLRALAALAFLASIPLVWIALAGEPERRRFRFVCAYGLNPVVLWSAAEGHNDTLLLVVAGCAAVVARRGGRVAAATLLGLSTTIKAPGALFAVLYGFDGLVFRRRAEAAVGAAGGLAVAAALVLPPLLPALRAVGSHGRYAPAVSLQAAIGPGAALAVAAALAVNGVRLLAVRRRAGYAWAGLAIVAALPNPYPWYALWLVPLALAGSPSAAGNALYGVTIFSVLRYLPDATGNMTVGALDGAAFATLVPPALACARYLRKKVVARS